MNEFTIFAHIKHEVFARSFSPTSQKPQKKLKLALNISVIKKKDI